MLQRRSLVARAAGASFLALLSACDRSSLHTNGAPPQLAAAVRWSLTQPEPCAFAPGNAHAFVALPGLGDDFRFAAGSTFVEQTNGSAFLAAVLERASDAAQRFDVRLDFSNCVKPGDAAWMPRAKPHAELDAEAYADAGGPIDVDSWSYYDVQGGELFGLGSLAGARIVLAAADEDGAQCGAGANNMELGSGFACRLAAHVVAQPVDASFQAADSDSITLDLALREHARMSAAPADGDVSDARELVLPGIGTFALVGGGDFVEHADGSARFQGVFADVENDARRFVLDLAADARMDRDFAGAPHLALASDEYRTNGGPIDPETWRYYTHVTGTLDGVDDLVGARIELVRGEWPLQVGFGASGLGSPATSAGLGASTSLLLNVVAQPLAGALPTNSPPAQLLLGLRRDYFACADEAPQDPVYGVTGGQAFWIPDLATDFQVVAGGVLHERADGTAYLEAEIQSASDATQHWWAELHFTQRVDAGDPGYPPAGSPKKLLLPSAYVENGGPIDTGTWHYYLTTDGFLYGLDTYQGGLIGVSRTGPAFQVGVGANGMNLHYGGSGWIALTTLNQPIGGGWLPATLQDGDANFDFSRGCKRCPARALRDDLVYGGTAGHALYMPGIGLDFVLEPGAVLIERTNGTALLQGVFARSSNPGQRFAAHVEFDQRVDAGESGYPPAGSPKKELFASAYVEGGGPIDTNWWHYYLTTDGLLTGLTDFDGATIHLTRVGPAFQVGLGANGKNLHYGASGWLDVEIVTQPTSGPTLGATSHADFNLDVADECP